MDSNSTGQPESQKSAFAAYSRPPSASSGSTSATTSSTSSSSSSSAANYCYSLQQQNQWQCQQQHLQNHPSYNYYQHQHYYPNPYPMPPQQIQLPSLQHKWNRYWQDWQHYYAHNYPMPIQAPSLLASPAASPVIRMMPIPPFEPPQIQHQQQRSLQHLQGQARFSGTSGRSSLPMIMPRSGRPQQQQQQQQQQNQRRRTSQLAPNQNQHRGQQRSQGRRASSVNIGAAYLSPMMAVEPLDLSVRSRDNNTTAANTDTDSTSLVSNSSAPVEQHTDGPSQSAVQLHTPQTIEAPNASFATKKAWLNKWSEQQMERLQMPPPPPPPPLPEPEKQQQQQQQQHKQRISPDEKSQPSRKRQSIDPSDLLSSSREESPGLIAVEQSRKRMSLSTVPEATSTAAAATSGPTEVTCVPKPIIALQGNTCQELASNQLPMCRNCRLLQPTCCRFKWFRKLRLSQGVLTAVGFSSLADVPPSEANSQRSNSSTLLILKPSVAVYLYQLSLLLEPLRQLLQRESDAIANWKGDSRQATTARSTLLWRWRERTQPAASGTEQPRLDLNPSSDDSSSALTIPQSAAETDRSPAPEEELCSRCHSLQFSAHLCCTECGYSLCITCAAQLANHYSLDQGESNDEGCPAWRHSPDRMKAACMIPPDVLRNLYSRAVQLAGASSATPSAKTTDESTSTSTGRLALPLSSLADFQALWIKRAPIVLTDCFKLDSTKSGSSSGGGGSSSWLSLPRQCANATLLNCTIGRQQVPPSQSPEEIFWRRQASCEADPDDGGGFQYCLQQWPAPGDVATLLRALLPEYTSPQGAFNLGSRANSTASSHLISGHSGSQCELRISPRDLVSLALLPPAGCPDNTEASLAAVWHVFAPETLPLLREQMRLMELQDIRYLDQSALDRLAQASQLAPIELRQSCGEAVLLPAGSVYQIRYHLTCTQAQAYFCSPETLTQSLALSWAGIKASSDSLDLSLLNRVQFLVKSLEVKQN